MNEGVLLSEITRFDNTMILGPRSGLGDPTPEIGGWFGVGLLKAFPFRGFETCFLFPFFVLRSFTG